LLARLALVHERDPSPQQWERIEGAALTMGKLMRLVEEQIGLQAAELEVLKACLEKRNWLSHDYWEQRSHLLASSEGCCEAVDELADLCDLFKKGDEVARVVSKRIRARVGISEQLVQGLQDEYVQRLRSGESREGILQDQEERLKRLSTHTAGTQ
jgi:hypothetical protein